jgi:transcriptional regulator with XRE-family HTH domain
MDFKDNLQKARELSGLTRVEIAKQLNMTPAAYGAYELGKREPKFDKLCEIADLLHVSIDDLLGYVPQNNANRIFNQYRAIGASVSKSITDKGFIVRVGHNRYWIESEADLAIVYDRAMKDEALIKDVKRMKAIALEMALFKYRKVGVESVRIMGHSADYSFAGEIEFSSPIGKKGFNGDIFVTEDDVCLSICVDSLGYAFPDEIVNLLKDDIAFYVAEKLKPYYSELADTTVATANYIVNFVDELHDEDCMTDDEDARLLTELYASKEADTNEPHPGKKK